VEFSHAGPGRRTRRVADAAARQRSPIVVVRSCRSAFGPPAPNVGQATRLPAAPAGAKRTALTHVPPNLAPGLKSG
jgi:hypothetical protein